MKDIFTHLDSNLLPPQAHERGFFSCVVMCIHTYLAFFLATTLIAAPGWRNGDVVYGGLVQKCTLCYIPQVCGNTQPVCERLQFASIKTGQELALAPERDTLWWKIGMR